MLKRESKFHSQLMRWLRYNLKKFPKSFLIETKVVHPRRNRFYYGELSEKEERLLIKAKKRTLLQTHSDISRLGTNCDGSVISGGGFIFIKWIRRGNKRFYAIDIEDIIKHKKTNKSLTENEAERIAYLVCEHV